MCMRLCQWQILGIVIHTFTDQQINIVSKRTELLCRSRISNECQRNTTSRRTKHLSRSNHLAIEFERLAMLYPGPEFHCQSKSFRLFSQKCRITLQLKTN